MVTLPGDEEERATSEFQRTIRTTTEAGITYTRCNTHIHVRSNTHEARGQTLLSFKRLSKQVNRA